MSKRKEEKDARIVPELNTKQVMEALKNSLDARQWAFFEELRIGGGFGNNSESRMDAWAISYLPSKHNVTRCYELKVSRSDFNHEISKPIKRRHGLRLSNEFWFIVPENMVRIEEVPSECGLIFVNENGELNTIIPAPYRNTLPLTNNFVSSICRRFDRDRLMEQLKTMGNEELLASTGNVMLEVIEQHINKWENTMGNKEIPLKIAESFRVFRNDVIDELIRQKIYK